MPAHAISRHARTFAACCIILSLAAVASAVRPDWEKRIGRDDPAKEGMSDSTYGAASNPTGEPIGGGTGYSRIVDPKDATVIVRDAEAFIKALKNAKAGDIVYVADDAVIDLTPYEKLTIPGGVTLASGRGRDGSEGGLLYTYTVKTMRLFQTGGPNVRVTGLRLEGSYPGRERLTQRPSMLSLSHEDAEVDNCEMFGWSCSAVGVGGGTKDTAWVHHNYDHHNQRNGLGYGVSLGRTHVLIEGNLFDFCRHAIASSGLPGSGYTARYNVHLENSISHMFDMHGSRDYEKYRLVGLWHFDDAKGTTANDYSIYNGDHDGTLVHMGDKAWAAKGRLGRSALRFDGKSGYVDMGKQRQLSPKTALVVAAFVNPDAVDGARTIFSKGDTGPRGSGYALRIVDGALEGILYDEAGKRCAALGGKIETGRWQYVAMTWDGKKTGNAVLYIDGEPVTTFTCKTRATSPNHLLVGRDSATATSFYKGLIDEARLYSAPLAPTDVKRQADGNGDIAGELLLVHHNTFRHTRYPALAVRGRPTIGCWAHHNQLYAPKGATMFRQVNATGNWHVSDNKYMGKDMTAAPDFSKLPLLAQWSFDGKSGKLVPDLTGNGRTGTIEGMDPAKAWVDGPHGKALAFDGEKTSFLSIPKAKNDKATESFTIGMRFRYSAMTEQRNLLDNKFCRFYHRGGWAGHRLYFLIQIDEDARAGESSWSHYAGVMTNTEMKDGEWYEAVGERDGEWVRIYLNGKLQSEKQCLRGMTPSVKTRDALVVFKGIKGAVDDLWIREAPSHLAEEKERQAQRVLLQMTGEKGYEKDGLEPSSGGADTMFRFRVQYKDAQGHAPAVGFPRVHIFRDGHPYLNEAPVTMMATDLAPFDKGRNYSYTMRLPRGSAYKYSFEVETDDGRTYDTARMPGPEVQTGSFAPVLSWTSQRGYVRDGCQPEIGDVATDFDFRILFSDLDGDLPATGWPQVTILKGKKPIPGSPFPMEPMNDVPTYNGRPYRYKTKLPAGEDYSYYFDAKDSDGNPAPRSLTRKAPTVDAGKDVAPPNISEIQATKVGPDSAEIVWKTDEPATSSVEYGPTDAYGKIEKIAKGRRTEHRVKLTALKPAATCHYRVTGIDESGNRATSGDYSFETKGR